MPHHDETPIQRLHAAIHAHREVLTPTERRIAAYFLEQANSLVLLSVQELSGQLHVGPASIVRVVKKLGYRGLADLKRDIRRGLHESRSPLEQFTRHLDSGDVAGLAEVTAIARQEIRNVETTMRLVDEGTFRRAVRILGRARGVFIVGVGVSAHLAGLAAVVLQHIGVRGFALQHTGLNVSEQLVGIGKRDALLAFSFPPYSTQTIDAAAIAKQRGASVVSVTNQAIAPTAQHSDVVLVAKTDTIGPSNSLSAPLVLMHGLAAAVAAASRPRSLKAMKDTLTIREDR